MPAPAEKTTPAGVELMKYARDEGAGGRIQSA